MTTKIMQRLAGKVSVLIMVALLIAAVGTYGLSNSKHESTGRATASVSPSKVETAPVANTPVAKNQAAGTVKAVDVSVRTVAAAQPASNATPPVTVTTAPASVAKEQMVPLQEARATYTKLPLSFIPNQGQFQTGVKYEARGMAYTASLTADAAYVGLHTMPANGQPGKQSLVRFGFAGANLRYEAGEKQSSYANYIGGPASRWRNHVPNYGRLTAAEVYPGIDATFYGTQSNLQYDFMVKPGADPKAIQLKIDGGAMKLDANGDLAIATELGTIYQRKPVLYQEANGVRQPVEGGYKVDGDRVSFEVGAYDAQRTLVIDPLINFSLVVGGGSVGIGDTMLNAVAYDQGAVYVAGTTTSNTLNLTGPSTISGARAASAQSDAIVVSFTRDGTAAIWYTFIGGSDQDSGLGIAVEDPTLNPSSGSLTAQPGIYLVGQTFSTDLALNDTAANHYQGNGDGFIVRLTGTGADGAGGPVYVGGANADSATSVAVRCVNGCAGHANQDNVFIGMSVSTAITAPNLTVEGPAFGTGTTAGAVVSLRASTLGTGGVHGTVLYLNATAGASVTALALLPYPVVSGTLVPATRLAFVGNVLTPGGLNGNAFVKAVQGGHGGVDTFGFGGGNADGMWGVTSTQLSGGGTPLDTIFNLDYVGGLGNDNVKAVAALPDQNIVVVGDTSALPFSTTGGSGVINGATPPQNTSFGTNGLAATGGGEDVVAVIINPGAANAAATAVVGTTATASVTAGTPATGTVTYGTPAVVAPAAAGVQALDFATPGTRATMTITHGTPFTVAITQGTSATANANLAGTAIASVTITAGGSGFGTTAPTVTFVGDGCTITPTAFATLTAGSVTQIVVTNGGAGCTGTAVQITAPGIVGISLGTGGTGYQGGGTAISVPFDGTCSVPPTATATISATGSGPNNTNASVTGVTLTSSGAGCTIQPTTPGTNALIPTTAASAPGIVSAVINNPGTGYQGGNTVSATFNGTCAAPPTAQTTVPNSGTSNQPIGTTGTNILTNSGSGCTAQPTNGGSTLTAPGITSVTVSFGGTGYSSADAPLIVFGGTCTTPPVAVPVINNSAGNITSITLNNSGAGCTVPPIVPTIGAPGITNINVTNGGTGYSAANPPMVTIGPPQQTPLATFCANPATAQATGVANVSAGGVVTGVTVVNEGCGYTSNPTVTLSGPGVTANITNGGTGYATPVTVTFTNTAANCTTAPTASGVTVNASGTITGLTGFTPGACNGGSGSIGISFSSPGVTGITTLTGGTGYTVAPTLSFTGCTTQPSITAPAPVGGSIPIPGTYTVNSFGACAAPNCSSGSPAVTRAARGRLTPPEEHGSAWPSWTPLSPRTAACLDVAAPAGRA